jgi:hypothetical protein
MSVIHITGMFGWTGTPYCFQVVTRVLNDLCKGVISGDFRWYVDDLMGISLRKNTDADMAAAAKVCRGLLGPDSVADDKSEKNRRMVCLGWVFDLNTLTVAISKKNMLKVLYYFFCFDIKGKVKLDLIEKISSLASRYAMLCRHMTPHTSSLYKCIAGYKGNHNKTRKLSHHARADVAMWRAFLCLLHFDEARYARPLSSFIDRPPSVLIQYDACLEGFGVGVSSWSEDNERFELLVYTSLKAPYEVTNDSSRQNTNEYLGIMLGLLLIYQTKCVEKSFAFNVEGDNTTSLKWCASNRVSSALARRADIGFSILAVELDASVSEVTHIPGVDNVVYDGLSRGKGGLEVGLPPEKFIKLSPDTFAYQYMCLCNPDLPLSNIKQHTALSTAFLDLIGEERLRL